MEGVERQVDLPGSARAVWASITDGLSDWFGAEVDVERHAGGRATFRWPDGRERGAIVEDFRPPRRFSFRWLPFEKVAGELRPTVATRVEMTLEEVQGGVRLRVTERPLGSSSAMTRTPAWAG